MSADSGSNQRNLNASYNSHNYRPKPQTNRPYGYGYGHNHGYNNHGYGQYSYHSKPQQQYPQYSNPCAPQYLNPALPQVSPPGPIPWDQQYLDPTLPQISPPGPYYDQQYLDPTLPQISPPYFPERNMSSQYEPDNFIDRTRSDLDDIRVRGERNINHTRDQIRRNEKDAREFVVNDVMESARLFDLQGNEIRRAVGSGENEDLLIDCIRKSNSTVQQRANDDAARSQSCINSANKRAEATIDQTSENLSTDAKSTAGSFDVDADRLRQCSAENNRICSKNQVQLISRNIANFASDSDNHVKTAQAAAIQHSIDLAACRSMQDQSHRGIRGLARELSDDCFANTKDISGTSS